MSVRTERKAIRYVTLHFQDRRGAASLRYKNRAEILRVNGSFILYGIVSALELSGTARTHPELVWLSTIEKQPIQGVWLFFAMFKLLV